ncbi:hypothetical protein V8G54_035517 [Vigna mungo]|uniref:Pre-mRNA-processing factor 19 n=1 Tax=Vigna mungo TaxID=3915 RepID=A0AAQ3RB25_VIGMU
MDDIVPIKTGKIVKPRPVQAASIPGMLGMLQNVCNLGYEVFFMIFGMGWVDAIKFCIGAKIAHDKARAESCSLPGFGVNIVTVVMVVVLGFSQKIDRRSDGQMTFLEKIVLEFIPAVGACLSIADIVFLWKKEHSSHIVGYHKWFYSCSELMVRVLICITESLVVLLNISFGIAINVIRIKRPSYKNRYILARVSYTTHFLEDPFLSNGVDLEEGGYQDLENDGNFWDLMTFNFITPVMTY